MLTSHCPVDLPNFFSCLLWSVLIQLPEWSLKSQGRPVRLRHCCTWNPPLFFSVRVKARALTVVHAALLLVNILIGLLPQRFHTYCSLSLECFSSWHVYGWVSSSRLGLHSNILYRSFHKISLFLECKKSGILVFVCFCSMSRILPGTYREWGVQWINDRGGGEHARCKNSVYCQLETLSTKD